MGSWQRRLRWGDSNRASRPVRIEQRGERTRYGTCNGAQAFPLHFLWTQLRFASLDRLCFAVSLCRVPRILAYTSNHRYPLVWNTKQYGVAIPYHRVAVNALNTLAVGVEVFFEEDRERSATSLFHDTLSEDKRSRRNATCVSPCEDILGSSGETKTREDFKTNDVYWAINIAMRLFTCTNGIWENYTSLSPSLSLFKK